MEELRTEVTISEEDKQVREKNTKELLRKAYKECKEIIRNDGTLAGARCICKKIENKRWQSKLLFGR